MKHKFTPLLPRAHRPWLRILALWLMVIGFQACSTQNEKELPRPVANVISSDQLLKVAKEAGFDAKKVGGPLGMDVPFATEAEAQEYFVELRLTLDGKSDGKKLQALVTKYMPVPDPNAPGAGAPRVQLIRLEHTTDIFQNSPYKGYRYAVVDPSVSKTDPKTLEIVTKTSLGSDEEIQALAAQLYDNLQGKVRKAGGFTGYAFLYNSKYRYLKGSTYADGLATPEPARILRYVDRADSPHSPEKAGGGVGNKVNGCVHWIDYYVGGTYVTTTCLEYAVYSDPVWGGTSDPTGGSPTGGGGGSGGGGGGGGGDPIPVDDPNAPDVGSVLMPGNIPGVLGSSTQQFYVYFNWDGSTVSNVNSGFLGSSAYQTWVHIGGRGSGASHLYILVATFKVETKISDVVISFLGPANIDARYQTQNHNYIMQSLFGTSVGVAP